MNNKYITPGMKLSELFESYPELELTINELIPLIEKFKIKSLRDKVYNSTTIESAAKTTVIEVSDFINILREKVGQNTMTNSNAVAPEWANYETANYKIDAKPMIEAGEHPLTEFMAQVDKMTENQVILLITPFLPAPLIENSFQKP